MPLPWQPLPFLTTTIVASPADATEIVVASVKVGSVGDASSRVLLNAWTAFTYGANATGVRLRIRQGSLTGTVVADTGALTAGAAAAALEARTLRGVDAPGEVASQTYVLTMQVAGATTASTISALVLDATPIG